MDLGINGKIALVAAASRGLGRGCARQLAAQQCRVAICGRNAAAAEQAAREIESETGSQVVGFGADVQRAQDVDQLVRFEPLEVASSSCRRGDVAQPRCRRAVVKLVTGPVLPVGFVSNVST